MLQPRRTGIFFYVADEGIHIGVSKGKHASGAIGYI
jgi:hypothetical protein